MFGAEIFSILADSECDRILSRSRNTHLFFINMLHFSRKRIKNVGFSTLELIIPRARVLVADCTHKRTCDDHPVSAFSERKPFLRAWGKGIAGLVGIGRGRARRLFGEIILVAVAEAC